MGIIQGPSREHRAHSKGLGWWKELKLTTGRDESLQDLEGVVATLGLTRGTRTRSGGYFRESGGVSCQRGQ